MINSKICTSLVLCHINFCQVLNHKKTEGKRHLEEMDITKQFTKNRCTNLKINSTTMSVWGNICCVKSITTELFNF